jgi:hypothetical protein
MQYGARWTSELVWTLLRRQKPHAHAQPGIKPQLLCCPFHISDSVPTALSLLVIYWEMWAENLSFHYPLLRSCNFAIYCDIYLLFFFYISHYVIWHARTLLQRENSELSDGAEFWQFWRTWKLLYYVGGLKIRQLKAIHNVPQTLLRVSSHVISPRVKGWPIFFGGEGGGL